MAAGIDEEEWNPATDVHIEEQYSASNFTRGKAKNKAALQRELGLPVRADVPLVGFIGRLDYQKGADLVLAAAPWLISQDVQLICLGTGDSGLEVTPRLAPSSILQLLPHIAAFKSQNSFTRAAFFVSKDLLHLVTSEAEEKATRPCLNKRVIPLTALSAPWQQVCDMQCAGWHAVARVSIPRQCQGLGRIQCANVSQGKQLLTP